MKLDRILMPTDFSNCADSALSHAIFLAQQYGAELHLLHVVVLHGESPQDLQTAFPDIEEIYTRLRDIAATEMGRTLRARQLGTLRVREVQRRGVAAAPTIVDYAAEEEIDLVVLGTHGRRGIRRFLLGSVAEEVVRTAGCPVVTVPYEDVTSVESIDRILVPYDFSADSEGALETAKELAATYGSQLDVVHAITPPMGPDGLADVPALGGAQIDLEKAVADALAQRVAAAAGPDVPADTHIVQGGAASEVADFASELGADLIVIGSHGLTGLSHFLLGSVSERVVRLAHCPVLVLRRSGLAELTAAGMGDPARLVS